MRHRRQSGMTLIEVAITVAILALVVGIVLPSLANLGRADLRKASTLLAGQMREAFEGAALEGKTFRLTFKIGSGEVKVEATDELLRIDASRGGAVLSQSQLLAEYAPPPGTVQSGLDPNTVAAQAALAASPMGALMQISEAGKSAAHRAFEPRGKLQLEKGIRVLDVWTEGLDTAQTEGEIYIYFFPGGYAQDALVHLEDEVGRVFSLQLAPMTGRIRLTNHYVDVPK